MTNLRFFSCYYVIYAENNYCLLKYFFQTQTNIKQQIQLRGPITKINQSECFIPNDMDRVKLKQQFLVQSEVVQ